MSLKQLENIIVLSEEKSISRAAKRLFISQPALSQQLLKLEDQLGTPLFFRGTKELTPTPAGKIYIKGAREILDIQKQTFAEIRELLSAPSLSFSIGVSANRSSDLVSRIYPSLMEKYPTGQMQLIEHPFLVLETLLTDRKVDLIFTLLSNLELARGVPFAHASLSQEPMHLALSRKHPMAHLIEEANERHAGVNIKIFQNEGFALSLKTGKLRTLSDLVFEAAQIPPNSVNVMYESFAARNLCSVAERTELCTLLPVSYISKTDNLLHAPIAPVQFSEFSICWNWDHILSPLEQYFILLCQEYCHQIEE